MRFAAGVLITVVLALAPAAHAAGPNPTFAPTAQGAFVPGGVSAIFAFKPCPGNFNGDGNVDVAVPIVTSSGPEGLMVMDGDGTGHLGTPTMPISSSGQNFVHCAVGDFNGDGRDDIATIEETQPGIQIALGNANGGFSVTTIDTAPLGAGTPTDIATGDIDNDGKLDLAVTWKNNDRLFAFKGDGSGGFALQGTPVPLSDDPAAVVLVDVNNDNRADALVGELNGANFERSSGQSDGSLQSPAVGQAVGARSFAPADFNGDGSIDVAVDNGNFIEIRRGNNSGSFTSSGGQYPNPFNPNLTVLTPVAGDFNNDGLPDVVTGAFQKAGVPANVWAFAGTGDPTVGNWLDKTAEGPYQLDSGTQKDTRIAAADFNNDGRLDVVGGTITGGKVGVLLNTTPVPGAVTGAATPADDSASIAGTVYPSGISTQYGVDLISQSGAVDRKPAAGTASGNGSLGVTIALGGLTPDSDYRYRVYATSANGTTVGKIRTFHTKIARPANQSPPSLSGDAKTGSALTCTDGTWTGSPTFTVAWLRGGNVIAGETGHTYTVQPADGGSAIGCRVTATNAGGSASADSATFVIGAGQFPANRTAPTAALTGGVLVCNAGEWSAGGTFTYAWLRDGNPIAGATGPGYVVKNADAGHSLACHVTLTNSAGSASADSGGVAIPPLRCIVPKLRGLTVKAAKTKLAKANCATGKIVKRRGKGVKIGRVLKSSPKAGAVKPAGTNVKLFVRKR